MAISNCSLLSSRFYRCGWQEDGYCALRHHSLASSCVLGSLRHRRRVLNTKKNKSLSLPANASGHPSVLSLCWRRLNPRNCPFVLLISATLRGFDSEPAAIIFAEACGIFPECYRQIAEAQAAMPRSRGMSEFHLCVRVGERQERSSSGFQGLCSASQPRSLHRPVLAGTRNNADEACLISPLFHEPVGKWPPISRL